MQDTYFFSIRKNNIISIPMVYPSDHFMQKNLGFKIFKKRLIIDDSPS